MAAFDLQEQEQIATLKPWWQSWGKWMALGIAALLIGFAVKTAWQSYQKNQMIKAAEVFSQIEANLAEDGKFTLAEKDLVADVLVISAEGAPVEASAIEAAGLEYRDLPPLIPVEVREDANGNPVVIQAEVASALLVLESPAALLGAVATCFNPDEAIEGLTEEQKCELGKALLNIGADMSIPEREKAEDIVVVTIIAGQIVLGTAYRRRV